MKLVDKVKCFLHIHHFIIGKAYYVDNLLSINTYRILKCVYCGTVEIIPVETRTFDTYDKKIKYMRQLIKYKVQRGIRMSNEEIDKLLNQKRKEKIEEIYIFYIDMKKCYVVKLKNNDKVHICETLLDLYYIIDKEK